MKDHKGPIYEVTLSVDRGTGEELDVWLAGHVVDMLELPGFVGADTYALDDTDDQAHRVTCYYVESQSLLDAYLENEAATQRQAAVDHFGDRIAASRRVLHKSADEANNAIAAPNCLNCNAALNGQYCGQCGQRASSRLISIWELTRDAFGDLFEFDSRLWRTLIPLVMRPGLLTLDYLSGRRARYVPPFRMYIVLSLVFFLVAFFNPRESLGILFPAESDDAGQSAAAEAASEIRSELQIGLGEDTEEDPGDRCQFENYPPADMPAWITRRLTKERLQASCNRFIAEDGQGIQGFIDQLTESIPAGLFILLPMMALALKILYPLSRRYYVEHLLFVVHFHAFVFLAITARLLFSRFVAVAGLPNALDELSTLAVTLFIPVYLYKAQRRVYTQRRWITVPKLILLLLAYVAGLTLILATAVILAAFSV